jgi:hypothetical protein
MTFGRQMLAEGDVIPFERLTPSQQVRVLDRTDFDFELVPEGVPKNPPSAKPAEAAKPSVRSPRTKRPKTGESA